MPRFKRSIRIHGRENLYRYRNFHGSNLFSNQNSKHVIEDHLRVPIRVSFLLSLRGKIWLAYILTPAEIPTWCRPVCSGSHVHEPLSLIIILLLLLLVLLLFDVANRLPFRAFSPYSFILWNACTCPECRCRYVYIYGTYSYINICTDAGCLNEIASVILYCSPRIYIIRIKVWRYGKTVETRPWGGLKPVNRYGLN